MSIRLLAGIAAAAALSGCLGARVTETVPLPPEPDLASCPELAPPSCDWTEPDRAPPTLRALEAALGEAWTKLARCAEDSATARREWASCPGNRLEETQ